ncbi:MAG: coproporphyrinogen III oxidase, partial [Trebouxia sp. A1-2]
MQDYITLLCREIAATVKVPGPPLRTVFFGGGTPTLVPPQLLNQILIALNNQYGIAKDAEISMESDPGTFDMLRLQEYMSLGINRFSMGVQCFQQELLELCGRSHTLEDVHKAINDIHKAGVQNWSLDLISGLPQLNSKRWQHSLQEAVSAGPTHISVYDLQASDFHMIACVEAKTPFARWYEPGSHPMPTEAATADMYRAASHFLQQSGYEHYEISNYAKPAFRSQHNLGYWKNAPFYAFGVGAASYLFQRRFSRPRTIKAYQQWVTEFDTCSSSKGLCAGNIPGIGSMQAEAVEEQLLDYVMLRLRLADGIPMAELQHKFGHVAAQT